MEFDVVVSGAGIVGLCAAHTFAQQGYATLLVGEDDSHRTLGAQGVDRRTVALAPVAIAQLQELAVDLPSACGSISAMHVWEDEGSAAIDMRADEICANQLAAVFENHRLVQALLNASRTNLSFHLTGRLNTLDTSSRTLNVQNLGTVETKFLVVAEGSNSSTVGQLNGQYSIDQDLQQTAVATTVELKNPHKNTAWQIFQPTPLALLPMAQTNLMSLIWSMPTSDAAQIKEISDAAFLKNLNEACASVVGELVSTDRRMSFPLSQRLLADFNPLPWVLILGDAAHTLHPLAGQGVNLGLEDVRAIQGLLRELPDRIDRPGSWRAFSTRRQLRARSMLHLMSFFTRIYASSSPTVRLLRNVGVRQVNATQTIKRQLIREAMGLGPMANAL